MTKQTESQPEGTTNAVVLPLIPLVGTVLFPNSVRGLKVSRPAAVAALREALLHHRGQVVLVAQRDGAAAPRIEDLYPIGTIAQVSNMTPGLSGIEDYQGEVHVFLKGLVRAQLKGLLGTTPSYRAIVSPLPDPAEGHNSVEHAALVASVRESFARLAGLDPELNEALAQQIDQVKPSGVLADIVAFYTRLPLAEAQAILEALDPQERLRLVYQGLVQRLEVLEVKRKLEGDVQESFGKAQRAHVLREQMRIIQKELGEDDSQTALIEQYQQKIAAAGLSAMAAEQANRELNRLKMVPSGSPEFGVITNYLDWLVELPWSRETDASVAVAEARRIFDEDHFGLEKVKERLLEYLAVQAHSKGRARSPIMILVGPPGTGKTSLAKATARAMGRKAQRLSLGGVRDEAEIRGHRRTYVGALPGRFIHALKMVGVKNPVIVLDEIDKLGSDFRGDPAAALLEVLDPEQNHEFTDHFLEVPFDLSHVVFICTANSLDTVPAPLLDRLEVIEVNGYTEDEKVQIATRYLLPKQLQAQGLEPAAFSLTEAGLRQLIRGYTRESGVRNLDRLIGTLCRKAVMRIEETGVPSVAIDEQNLAAYLGHASFSYEAARDEDEVGVATGVAVTSAGGEILTVEATLVEGRPGMTLTGHLGDVMKESARAALTYVRSRARDLGIAPDAFEKHEIHIHVPAGAIPKDGPSAGVTMVTTLASAFTGRPVRRDVAMTGEVTTRGRVLAIGGVREKLLAAKRAGVRSFILPERNRAELAEVPADQLAGIEVILVKNVDEVLRAALLPSAVPALAELVA